MKKKDLVPLVILIGILFAIPWIDRMFISKFFPAAPPKPVAAQAGSTNLTSGGVSGETALVGTGATGAVPVEATTPVPAATNAAAAIPAPAAAAPVREREPEQTFTISNNVLEVTLTSHGAGLKSARLIGYRQSANSTSDWVRFEFPDRPSLALEGVAGLDAAGGDFKGELIDGGRAVRFTGTDAGGLSLIRTLALTNNYVVDVRDEFRTAGEAVTLSNAALRVGSMGNLPGESPMSGVVFLGADVMHTGGKVQFLGGKLESYFKDRQKATNTEKPPLQLDRDLLNADSRADWLAIKNKYFTQILTPEGGAPQVTVVLERLRMAEDGMAGAKVKTVVQSVGAVARLTELKIEAGAPTVRRTSLYIGPKKFSELNHLGQKKVEVMEFGTWTLIGKFLLATMNGIHSVIPNYGISIILLTLLVRVVFWPLTHKSSQSMKRMAELQPKMKELQAKYKEDPKRMQKETMELYRAHKINPLSGCLPILVQIPVFIALFVVLRSAIELRFAPFLWVRDLSEAENLIQFGFTIPLLGWSALNILPLIMTATQIWQTKLTPQMGDPMQQKMMTWFMPAIMLFFFYNFASGLVLYWTANQCAMIVQLYWQRRKKAPSAAKAA